MLFRIGASPSGKITTCSTPSGSSIPIRPDVDNVDQTGYFRPIKFHAPSADSDAFGKPDLSPVVSDANRAAAGGTKAEFRIRNVRLAPVGPQEYPPHRAELAAHVVDPADQRGIAAGLLWIRQRGMKPQHADSARTSAVGMPRC
jgi:hypothetical protein